MKHNTFFTIVLLLFLLFVTACQSTSENVTPLQHTEPPTEDDSVSGTVVPDDFSFYMESGSNFFCSYDSKTGKYMTNYVKGDEKTANVQYVKLSQYELKQVYRMITSAQFSMDAIPEDLTPFVPHNNPFMTTVNYFYTLKVHADGKDYSIKMDDIYSDSQSSTEYETEAVAFSIFMTELATYLSEQIP